MRLAFSCLLLLLSHDLVSGAPCRSLQTVEECQGNGTVTNNAVECFWCEELSSCVEDSVECEPIVGASDPSAPCLPLESEEACVATTTCIWCSEIESCGSIEDNCTLVGGPLGCNGENCTGEDDETLRPTFCEDANCTDTDGNVTSTGGGVGNPDVCSLLVSDAECSASLEGCVWCADEEFCGSNQGACNMGDPMTENDIDCRPLETEDNCTSVESCIWCTDNEMCRNEGLGCPGEMGGGDDDDDNEMFNCNSVGNETECVAAGSCFWCAEQEVCRLDFGQCPGNGMMVTKPNICAPLKNETECIDSGSCFWCLDKSLCRASEEECPGMGRGNACKDLAEETCDLTDGCAWLEEPDRCGSARGNTGGAANVTEYGANVCPFLTDQGNCTMQVQCRWCPSSDDCQGAKDVCDDGTLGARGNPCGEAGTEEVCTDILGCLWCAESLNCTKATILGCDVDSAGSPNGGNICRVQDVKIECDEIDECQWCDAQAKCKQNQTVCEDPSGEVDLDFEEMSGPGFKILDDGLGQTDPNSVSVVLSYLYEITAGGETIGSSLVDLESQAYTVKQTIGTFFGDIEARRIQFDANIDGVGKITLDAYIMLSDGNVTTPGTDEAWVVSVGDVKFNVELSDWNFCDDESPCGASNDTSAFVDLAFAIQGGSESPEQSESNSLLFSLGGNVPLLLSSQVEVDGKIEDMPEGFPRVESKDSQGTVFFFRFPRFEEAIKYDPIIPYHYSIPILTDGPKPTVPPSVPSAAPVAPTTAPNPVTEAPAPKQAKKEEESDKPSGGSIAGIVIGSLLGLCCCCAGLGYAARKKRGENGYDATADADAEEKNNVTVDAEGFDDEADGRAESGDEEEGEDSAEEDEDAGSSGDESDESEESK